MHIINMTHNENLLKVFIVFDSLVNKLIFVLVVWIIGSDILKFFFKSFFLIVNGCKVNLFFPCALFGIYLVIILC